MVNSDVSEKGHLREKRAVIKWIVTTLQIIQANLLVEMDQGRERMRFS